MAREIDVKRLETIRPLMIMPWADRSTGQTAPLEAVKLRASSPPESEVNIFTEGLQRNGKVGIDISCMDSNGTTIIAYSSIVGKSNSTDILFAELQAIYQAVEFIYGTWPIAILAEYPKVAKVSHAIYR